MKASARQGLLIDYEYCTGCYTCQVACAQEYRRPKEQIGMHISEIVTMKANNKPYITYVPFPTENCNLCIGRTSRGLEPACVKHCMARVIKYGEVEDLAEEMRNKGRMVLWAPK